MALTIVEAARAVTGGVDTHRDVNMAAALDDISGLLGVEEFATDAAGHKALVRWLCSFDTVMLVGVEGTGSYGVGLAQALRAACIEVVEVDRPNRLARRRQGKSDPLDAVETARMLATAHVAGGDGMIACFEAKYTYWFWRPAQAIPRADTDGNPATEADTAWRPLRTTPNFPEYPSAHACHTAALAEALRTFFGTGSVSFSLDSRITATTRDYRRLHDVIKDVNRARVLSGFHFRNSDQEGSMLGSKVGRYVGDHLFRPLG